MTLSNYNVQMSDTEFSKLRAIVHKTTGITIDENRKTMLVSRLRKRLHEVDETSFSGYISKLLKDSDELQEFTNRVTTNETYFYRTPRVWEYFENDFIPTFLEKPKTAKMRVWSAAASTGEEGHTIGVLLENQRLANSGFDYSVLGTDISTKVLDVARTGQYKGRAISRFRSEKPDLFQKYMTGNDTDGFAVTPQIQSRLSFKQHNLLDKFTGVDKFDIVFLRNVLIYFTGKDKEIILNNIHQFLKPDGILIIGESESLKNLNTGFTQLAPIIYRKSTQAVAS